jgi:hypothetical protein
LPEWKEYPKPINTVHRIFSTEIMKGRDYFEEAGVVSRIILKSVVKE